MKMTDCAQKPIFPPVARSADSTSIFQKLGPGCSLVSGTLNIRGRSPATLFKIDLTAPQPVLMIRVGQTFQKLSDLMAARHNCEMDICLISEATPEVTFTFSSRREGTNPFIGKKFSDLTMAELNQLQESTPNNGSYSHRLSRHFPKIAVSFNLQTGAAEILDPGFNLISSFFPKSDPLTNHRAAITPALEDLLSEHFSPDGMLQLKEAIAGVNGIKLAAVPPEKLN